jgi:hypothetical protein
MSSVPLYTVLRAFYEDGKKAELKKYGFDLISQFSSKNLQTYFEPEKKIMIMSIKGTNPSSIPDLRTDISLAIGRLKQTKRFKDAEKMLIRAKAELKPSKTIVVGFSLGGAIGSALSSYADKVYTFNRGATIGSTTKKNEESYRVKGDLVSANLSGATTLPKDRTTTDLISPALGSHELTQLKNDDVMIFY